MLSNNGLCLCADMQYVLLFLVWFNNSDRFQILPSYTLLLTLAARSYAPCRLKAGCIDSLQNLSLVPKLILCNALDRK